MRVEVGRQLHISLAAYESDWLRLDHGGCHIIGVARDDLCYQVNWALGRLVIEEVHIR